MNDSLVIIPTYNEKENIGRMAMASLITLTRFSILPTPKMPHCGWLMMGVAKRLPETP